ncbi:hypothetical protein [Pseudomonas saponiphila]|uniref:hypothetical protein n=1 Tax=Pseudomonas saponiphila TaxID=556534 RepID=UPI00115FEE4E|nr:hypothetical protein [Pseudomonas saponiphila]
MSQELRTRFTFTEGSSDKEYIIQLKARDGGFVLITYHGRRGSTLTETLKTKAPSSTMLPRRPSIRPSMNVSASAMCLMATKARRWCLPVRSCSHRPDPPPAQRDD